MGELKEDRNFIKDFRIGKYYFCISKADRGSFWMDTNNTEDYRMRTKNLFALKSLLHRNYNTYIWAITIWRWKLWWTDESQIKRHHEQVL